MRVEPQDNAVKRKCLEFNVFNDKGKVEVYVNSPIPMGFFCVALSAKW